MDTKFTEIADGVYRISTYIRRSNLTFNQFIIKGDESVLFHCGQNALYQTIRETLTKNFDLNQLRWISFSHVEADECGSLNQWLIENPTIQVFHGRIAYNTWLCDLDRTNVRLMEDCSILDVGGKLIQWIDTPHVPHNWDSGMIFEESTKTLFCSDLFTQLGEVSAIRTQSFIDEVIRAEEKIGFSSPTSKTIRILDLLISKQPRTLATMHGSAFQGDCVEQLELLKFYYLEKMNSYTKAKD